MRPGTRRLLLLVLSLAALGAIAAWAATAFERVETTVVAPPRGEAARDPQFAAKRLVRALGGTAVAVDGFQRLPPPGAVLVLASPHANLFPGGLDALLAWVRAGGRLVLDLGAWRNAPLAEAIPLDRAGDEDPGAELERLPQRLRDLLAVSARCRPLDVPAAVAPTSGVEARRYDWCGEAVDAIEAEVPLAWALAEGAAVRVARVPLGAGSVTLSALRRPFDRSAVLQQDNALAFAATLDLRVADTVWFVGDTERTTLPALLWRTAWPAIVLLGLAIAFSLWRAGVRFGPVDAAPDRTRRSVGEQVRRTAAFVAGRGGGIALHAAAARALAERARRTVAGWRDDVPLPEQAARIVAHLQAEARARPGGVAVDAARLAGALRPATARLDRRSLAEALAVLEQARRALAPPAS